MQKKKAAASRHRRWPWPPPSPCQPRRAPRPRSANEAATARHYAALVAGAEPKTAELTMFFTQMPKGGDLHHHYSGAIYAEQYRLPRQAGLLRQQADLPIETDKAVVEPSAPSRPRSATAWAPPTSMPTTSPTASCCSAGRARTSITTARQAPPDRQFFQTFGYFGPVSNANFHEGLQS
jgi:adenosine deaminase